MRGRSTTIAKWVVEIGEFSALDFAGGKDVSAVTGWVELCADKDGLA